MNRRQFRTYTVWIARTGKEPLVLSIRPEWLAMAIGVPIVLASAVLAGVVYRNIELTRENTQLAKEASGILEKLRVLESTLTRLQEKAKLSEDESMPDEYDQGEYDEYDQESFESESSGEELDYEEGDRELDSRLVHPNESLAVAESAVKNFTGGASEPLDLEPIGGGGQAVGAAALLELAKAKLPELISQLQGEVEPALQEVIVREDAKPQGMPITTKGMEVTSLFGLRANPFGWGYEFHQGMDFVADYGTPIYATAPGVVAVAQWESGFGNHVVIDHNYGYETLYGHLSEITVKAGDRIDRHRIVGYLGNTGRSSGPHLHYSVFHDGQALDPQKYLD